MQAENVINLIVAILSGLAVCIPLVVKLVQYVRQAAQEKNWSAVMSLVLELMKQAEQNYKTGAERKEFVMDSIIAMQDVLNYQVDLDVIGAMVDSICAASKIINGKEA